jgi:hypothetical protein
MLQAYLGRKLHPYFAAHTWTPAGEDDLERDEIAVLELLRAQLAYVLGGGADPTHPAS